MKWNNDEFLIISGPCSLESKAQLEKQLAVLGRSPVIRAGIYKMRTSKDSFQGSRDEGIEIIRELKLKQDFRLTCEVVSSASLEKLKDVVDVFQIGTRNMYNYELLQEVGSLGKPVILKRAFSATLKEWLKAADYLALEQDKVILCERGIRTFEPSYRNVIDFNAVVYLKQHSPYKIIVDPSHGCGIRSMVPALANAALAAGADGLLIEFHPSPEEALSDGQQSLSIGEFNSLHKQLKISAASFGKTVILNAR